MKSIKCRVRVKSCVIEFGFDLVFEGGGSGWWVVGVAESSEAIFKIKLSVNFSSYENF